MKKIFTLALAAAMALSMAACGSTAQSTSTADSNVTASSVAESTASSVALTPDEQQISEYNGDYTTFNYSDGLNDDGMWDINTSDYITITDEYKNITLPADVTTVSDEDYQAQIDSVISKYTTTTQVTDRAIVDGDSVNIDYVGTVDGVEFNGGNTKGNGTNVVIGQTNYVDDFIDQLIGHKPGETFDVEVTFPDSYPQDTTMQGKDAVFAVTVNYITETFVPTLTDDAWVSENLGFDTAADFEEYLRSTMIRNQETNYIFEQLEASAEYKSPLPESIVLHEQNAIAFYYYMYATQYGMEIDDFLANFGFADVNALISGNVSTLLTSVKDQLLIQSIAEAADITVNEDDIAAYFESSTGSADYDTYKENYGLPYLKNATLRGKALDYVIENATAE